MLASLAVFQNSKFAIVKNGVDCVVPIRVGNDGGSKTTEEEEEG